MLTSVIGWKGSDTPTGCIGRIAPTPLGTCVPHVNSAALLSERDQGQLKRAGRVFSRAIRGQGVCSPEELRCERRNKRANNGPRRAT